MSLGLFAKTALLEGVLPLPTVSMFRNAMANPNCGIAQARLAFGCTEGSKTLNFLTGTDIATWVGQNAAAVMQFVL